MSHKVSKPHLPKIDSPEQEAFLNLWRTYDLLKELEEDLFSRHGLSAQQYNALRILQAVHPESMPTLAIGKRLISRAPDTTRLLDRLESRGWIVRNRLPENRRVVEVAITPSGISFLESLQGDVQAMHQQQLGHLSQKDQRELVRLLKLARGPHEQARDDWLMG